MSDVNFTVEDARRLSKVSELKYIQDQQDELNRVIQQIKETAAKTREKRVEINHLTPIIEKLLEERGFHMHYYRHQNEESVYVCWNETCNWIPHTFLRASE